MKKILLYSGGADSWLIDKLWKPDVKLYVNIHGEYNVAEMKRLPADVKVLDFPLLGQFEDPETHFVPLRNLYFLMLATHYGDHICFGATRGDRNRNDKTPEFINETEKLLRYTMGKQRGIFEDSRIIIERRYSEMYKHELIEEYLNNGGSIKELAEQTFSCYTPEKDEECMYCRSCFKKYAEMTHFGYKYPEEKAKKIAEYTFKHIIPKSENGGKEMFEGRGAEGAIWKQCAQELVKQFGSKTYEEYLNS